MTALQTVRIRIVGDQTRAETLLNMLHGIDGVAQVEAMPLLGSEQGAVCHVEVAVVDASAAWRIRAFAAGAAILMDASAEFVDQFPPTDGVPLVAGRQTC